MEISEALGFLKILSESIKLVPKNGRFMASIIFLSLLLQSILLLLFTYFYKTLTDYMFNSITESSDNKFLLRLIIYFILLLLVEISFLAVYIIISRISGLATILISSTSYSDKKVSSHDLIPRLRATWRKNLRKNFRSTRANNPPRYASFAYVLIFSLAIFYRNPITIAIAIVLGFACFVFVLYSSVVGALAQVVSIVEDSSEAAAAVERAEKLVEGQRHHGFIFNLLFNLLFMIVLGVCWINGLGVVLDGLIILNCFSVWMIFGSLWYTVFYFQCKKHHGEEILDHVVVASFEYTKLPDTKLGNDIP